MAEKKYIELEALMNVPIRRDHYDKKNGDKQPDIINFINGIEFVLEYAEYLPAADVVSVVRCKDCEYYDKKYHQCKLHSEEPDQYSTGFIFNMQEDDFCSYGERKDNIG